MRLSCYFSIIQEKVLCLGCFTHTHTLQSKVTSLTHVHAHRKKHVARMFRRHSISSRYLRNHRTIMDSGWSKGYHIPWWHVSLELEQQLFATRRKWRDGFTVSPTRFGPIPPHPIKAHFIPSISIRYPIWQPTNTASPHVPLRNLPWW